MLYGTAWSLFLAVMGTLCVSLWIQYGKLTDTHLVLAAYVIHCIAVLFGSMASGRACRDRGWFSGGMTGLVYAILMIVIGVALYNTFTVDRSGLFRVLLMVLIGSFGGIMGCNLKRSD